MTDPTIIRHLHDLAALKDSVSAVEEFAALVFKAVSADEGRGRTPTTNIKSEVLFDGMLERPASDAFWAREYQDYVQQVTYAKVGQLIGFDEALAAVRDLVALIPTGAG